MKRLFIIFFLTSISLYAQVQKDSVSSIDSITKLALTKKIKLLQTKLDSIIKNEKKEEVEKPWSVKGRVNFVFNQTSFSTGLLGERIILLVTLVLIMILIIEIKK